MPWLEAHQALYGHPKLMILSVAMTTIDQRWNDEEYVVGKLLKFWFWCQNYAENGDLRKHNDATLGGAVGLNGEGAKRFVTAMVEACWLDREPYFRVHDWWDYIGPWLRSKYKKTPVKWKQIKEMYGHEEDETHDEPLGNRYVTLHQPTYQPTNQPTNPPYPPAGGPESTGPPPATRKGVPIPEPLRAPEFLTAWQSWEEHLGQKRVKTTEKADEQQLQNCVELGVTRAVAAIRNSIANNYQGLYEPRSGRDAGGKPKMKSGKDWASQDKRYVSGG